MQEARRCTDATIWAVDVWLWMGGQRSGRTTQVLAPASRGEHQVRAAHRTRMEWYRAFHSLADQLRTGLGRLGQAGAGMIRIDAIWLAVEPAGMRAGKESMVIPPQKHRIQK